jgi:hypothetical protein
VVSAAFLIECVTHPFAKYSLVPITNTTLYECLWGYLKDQYLESDKIQTTNAYNPPPHPPKKTNNNKLSFAGNFKTQIHTFELSSKELKLLCIQPKPGVKSGHCGTTVEVYFRGNAQAPEHITPKLFH